MTRWIDWRFQNRWTCSRLAWSHLKTGGLSVRIPFVLICAITWWWRPNDILTYYSRNKLRQTIIYGLYSRGTSFESRTRHWMYHSASWSSSVQANVGNDATFTSFVLLTGCRLKERASGRMFAQPGASILDYFGRSMSTFSTNITPPPSGLK